MQFPWHPWRRKKRSFEGNPFISRKALGKFLGMVAAGLFDGSITDKEGREIQRTVNNFFRLLDVKDFAFDVSDALEPVRQEKLPYAT